MTQMIDWNDLYHMQPSSLADAEMIADIFSAAITDLMHFLEAENELLRTGQIDAALQLLDKKQEKSVDYTRATDLMRRNVIALMRFIPEQLIEIREQQQNFLLLISENSRLIATVRGLSENLLRGVAHDVGAKRRLATYGQNGKATVQNARTTSGSIIVSTHI